MKFKYLLIKDRIRRTIQGIGLWLYNRYDGQPLDERTVVVFRHRDCGRTVEIIPGRWNNAVCFQCHHCAVLTTAVTCTPLQYQEARSSRQDSYMLM